MNTSKKRFRLEIGDNWWSRLLILLYVVFGLAPLIKGNWIGSLSFLGGGWALWKVACWVVNGSELSEKRKEELKRNSIAVILAIVTAPILLILVLGLMEALLR